jgi:RNA polymerase-interacting CarD/CdnL/TRCF family regulator
MPFKIGDRVVHPHHGVGKITNLANKQFGAGESRAYYEIAIGDGTLWVPVDEPGLGLRGLTAKSKLEHCGLILEGPPSPLDINPRELRGQLSRHLREGTIEAQCEVVRDVSALSWRKPLVGPMADFRRMALSVLCQEWATVAEISLAEATDRINAHLGKGKQSHKL